MKGDFLYVCLMSLGWFFLVGWAIALVTACVVVFRQEGASDEPCPAPQLARVRLH
jgi:hypothetical protein